MYIPYTCGNVNTNPFVSFETSSFVESLQELTQPWRALLYARHSASTSFDYRDGSQVGVAPKVHGYQLRLMGLSNYL